MSRPPQKMKTPHLAPHICAKCRADSTSPREWFVDTGVDDFYDGIVYFCDSCFNDIAKTAGLFTRKQIDEMVDSNNDIISKHLKLVANMEVWEEAWKTLTGTSLQEFFAGLERLKENGKSSRHSVSDNQRPKSDNKRTTPNLVIPSLL